MSSIGPTLPPHVSKHSRDEDDDSSASTETTDKRRRVLGPSAPARTSGPSPPPDHKSKARSSSPESDIGPAPPSASLPSKPSRVLGPAPPPAPLSERPPNPPSDDTEDSSDDDDFGPAPPPVGGTAKAALEPYAAGQESAFDTDPAYVEEGKKVKRDDWMTMPPTQDDLAARMDPTRMRARKFNTGKGAQGASSGGGMGVWTETPEQKLKRLQNEALGVTAPPNVAEPGKNASRKSREEEAKARRIKEKLDKERGQSLMERHNESGVGKEEEDDPSKRGFDWEKDMGTGMKVGEKQRKEMLKRAKGFGDRFSSGSFL
ncbi:hypothetical protein M011DRAFT_492157 [Sporormia fimetaria CBS 119925]|uniref:DUF3752 domain-containing protein n=1 Tax=Sporormia fimetaria CBS 119925 TaxID=1340428 RepID=A0A6A6VKT5_9PLEO|nr:hypothetical protein M011DRAFT_492157 [Sporormia fimetaria CBS 119925]